MLDHQKDILKVSTCCFTVRARSWVLSWKLNLMASMGSSLGKASENMDYKNDCYKAIYSVSEKHQNGCITAKGKACAVDMEGSQFLVTSRDAVASPDASKEIVVDRFYSKYPKHIENYRCQVLNIREGGDLTIIEVKEELKPSLSVLVGNVAQDFRVFTFSGKDCFAVDFKYDSKKKTHQMKSHPGVPIETDLIGSPIIVERDRRFHVIGVLGRRNKELAPIFITGALFGECHIQC